MDTSLDERERLSDEVSEIGFAGGDPFMNPDFISMLSSALRRGYQVLVLTNAIRPLYHQLIPS